MPADYGVGGIPLSQSWLALISLSILTIFCWCKTFKFVLVSFRNNACFFWLFWLKTCTSGKYGPGWVGKKIIVDGGWYGIMCNCAPRIILGSQIKSLLGPGFELTNFVLASSDPLLAWLYWVGTRWRWEVAQLWVVWHYVRPSCHVAQFSISEKTLPGPDYTV